MKNKKRNTIEFVLDIIMHTIAFATVIYCLIRLIIG